MRTLHLNIYSLTLLYLFLFFPHLSSASSAAFCVTKMPLAMPDEHYYEPIPIDGNDITLPKYP